MKKAIKKLLCVCLVSLMAMPAVIAAEENKADYSEYVAYADLTEMRAVTVGMEATMGDGRDPIITEREGRKGWVLKGDDNRTIPDDDKAPASTIKCNIASAIAYDLKDGSCFEIEVDWYDKGQAAFGLAYSSLEQPNRFAGWEMTSVGPKGRWNNPINAWRTKKFLIQDAKFDDNFDLSDFKVSSRLHDRNHKFTSEYKSMFGKNYGQYYANTYPGVGSTEDIVIGAIRVKKLETKNPFKVEITTENYGNIFFDDEEMKFTSTVTNRFAKNYTLEAKYIIKDENERIVGEKTEEFSIAANETKTHEFSFTDMPFGPHTLTVIYSAEGIKNETTVKCSRSKEARETNYRACTNIHIEGADIFPYNPDAIIQLAKKAGYSSVREAIRWKDNEHSPGNYQMRATTQMAIDLCRQYGVDYMPCHIYSDGSPYHAANEPLKSEEQLKGYENFSAWLANHMKGTNTAVEAHNEWNLHFPTGTPDDYASMMKAMYTGTKRGNPDVKVLGIDSGGLDMGMMERWFAAGALEYMDVVTYHPYYHNRSFEEGGQMSSIGAVRNLMAKYGGGDKEIWCTETGWHQGTDNPITSEDKGYYIARAILQNDAIEERFDRIYFYEFLDGGYNPNWGENTYGTLDSPWSPTPYAAQPAYLSVANVNSLLCDWQFKDALTESGKAELTSRVYAYRYEPKGQVSEKGNTMVALWTCEDRADFGIDLGVDEATIIDMYGNERTIVAKNGVFSFTLTDRPVYLIGDFTEFKKVDTTIKINSHTIAGTVKDAIKVEITVPNAGNAKIVPVNECDFEVIENNGFVGDTATYLVATPDIKFFNKSVKFDVVDGDKVVYLGSIKINNEEMITITEEHKMNDPHTLNRWEMNITVRNNKNSTPIDGVLTINEPKEVSKYLPSIALNGLQPQETRKFRIFMPEIVTKEMRDFNVAVNLSSGEIFKKEHSMFFTTVPYAYNKPTIDAVSSSGEYSSETWFDIVAGENGENVMLLEPGTSHKGDNDLSGKATALYDEENIYFFIEITDDTFVQRHTGDKIWDGDSIQIGLSDQGTPSTYSELTVALTSEGPQMYRHLTNDGDNPVGFVENVDLQIVRKGTKTYYEMAIPWGEALNDTSGVGPGYKPRFAFLINEDDGLGRNSYMEYSQILGAIGTYKNTSYFSDMYLADK